MHQIITVFIDDDTNDNYYITINIITLSILQKSALALLSNNLEIFIMTLTE